MDEYMNYWTHDDITSMYIFKMKSEVDCRSFIARSLEQGSIEVFRFASRYLVRNTIDPVEAKLLLERYVVSSVYVAIKYRDKLNKELNNEYLDDIYENGLTIDKLKVIPAINSNKRDRFSELLNKEYKVDIKNTIKEILELCALSDTAEKHIKHQLYYSMDFFRRKTEFSYYLKEKKTCDLLIAEAISNNKNRSFDFEIPKDNANFDNFLKNVKNSGQERVDRNSALIVVAHLVNDVITNRDDIREVPLITSSELKAYSLSYEPKIKNLLKFMQEINKMNYVRLDKINEFKLRYNNKDYLFSRNGIIKL